MVHCNKDKHVEAQSLAGMETEGLPFELICGVHNKEEKGKFLIVSDKNIKPKDLFAKCLFYTQVCRCLL